MGTVRQLGSAVRDEFGDIQLGSVTSNWGPPTKDRTLVGGPQLDVWRPCPPAPHWPQRARRPPCAHVPVWRRCHGAGASLGLTLSGLLISDHNVQACLASGLAPTPDQPTLHRPKLILVAPFASRNSTGRQGGREACSIQLHGLHGTAMGPAHPPLDRNFLEATFCHYSALSALRYLRSAWAGGRVALSVVYRRTALPSFLMNYFGQKRIEKLLFWLKTDRLKFLFQAQQAQTGLNRIFKILFWPKRIDYTNIFAGRNEGNAVLRYSNYRPIF